jgi:hypothetical protein
VPMPADGTYRYRSPNENSALSFSAAQEPIPARITRKHFDKSETVGDFSVRRIATLCASAMGSPAGAEGQGEHEGDRRKGRPFLFVIPKQD